MSFSGSTACHWLLCLLARHVSSESANRGSTQVFEPHSLLPPLGILVIINNKDLWSILFVLMCNTNAIINSFSYGCAFLGVKLARHHIFVSCIPGSWCKQLVFISFYYISSFISFSLVGGKTHQRAPASWESATNIPPMFHMLFCIEKVP